MTLARNSHDLLILCSGYGNKLHQSAQSNVDRRVDGGTTTWTGCSSKRVPDHQYLLQVKYGKHNLDRLLHKLTWLKIISSFFKHLLQGAQTGALPWFPSISSKHGHSMSLQWFFLVYSKMWVQSPSIRPLTQHPPKSLAVACDSPTVWQSGPHISFWMP